MLVLCAFTVIKGMAIKFFPLLKTKEMTKMVALTYENFRQAFRSGRESVLFIDTHLSNLYTAVDTPAETA